MVYLALALNLHKKKIVFFATHKEKRLIMYSGLFKDAMKKFNHGELYKNKQIDEIEYVCELLYTLG